VLLGLLLWLLLEVLVAAWGDGPEAAMRAAGPLLASALVYGLSLVWAAGLLSAGPERAAVDHRRRVVVLGGSAGGALLVVGGALARISAAMGEQATMLARAKPGGDGSALATPPDHLSAALPTPASAQPIATEPTAVPNSAPAPFVAPPGVADEITPNERFYIVSKNLVDPRVQAENWSLEVFGLVKEPRSFSYQEVLALPSTSAYITLECISNPLGGKLMSNALWTGVPLAHLLGLVGVHVDARAVVFRSADNYYESFPLEVALAPTTLLAHAMNGVPLTEKHGFPLRVVLPGRYGMKQPKWVTKIELTADPIDGYWVRRGWDREAPPGTTTRESRCRSIRNHVGAGPVRWRAVCNGDY
jgi:DMSO/TMAO reductase YedYZ molybdopterin-dependent catalytic subunit